MSQISFTASGDLRAIFAHIADAKKYGNPYGLMPEMVTTPHVQLVKDSGIYLMSGNAETLPGRTTHNLCVYARGYNPKTNENCWEDARHAVGGDDFCEPLPVSEELIAAVLQGGSFYVDFEDDGRIAYGVRIRRKVKE